MFDCGFLFLLSFLEVLKKFLKFNFTFKSISVFGKKETAGCHAQGSTSETERATKK